MNVVTAWLSLYSCLTKRSLIFTWLYQKTALTVMRTCLLTEVNSFNDVHFITNNRNKTPIYWRMIKINKALKFDVLCISTSKFSCVRKKNHTFVLFLALIKLTSCLDVSQLNIENMPSLKTYKF